MGSNYSRGRYGKRRYYLPRKARLAIFLACVCLLILAVVFSIRGCSRRDAVVEGPAETVQPAPQDTYDTEQTEPEPEDAEPAPEEEEIPDEEVDLGETVVQPTQRPKGTRTAVIRSIGDIVVDKHLLKAAKTSDGYDFAPFLTGVAQAMGNADYTVLNVDGPMGGKKYATYKRYQGYPQFNTPPHLMNALKDCGVDMLTLANNHALDTYYDGLKAEIDNCEKVGLAHIGAFRSQTERDTPVVVDINGVKVGFLNYTVSTNNMLQRSPAEAKQYGLATTGNSNAPKDIQALRAAGAEAVLVYMHWGEEYKRTPEKGTRAMAKMLVEAGADAVIGGHPHMVQGAEWITAAGSDGQQRKGLVLYSMGNFFTEHAPRYTDSGIIYEFTIQANETGAVEIKSPKYVPVYVWQSSDKSNFKAVLCADVIQKRPSNMPDKVFKRVKQVWNELKEVFSNGIVEAAQK
ncbi:MAG: CapA family protein [Clostridia bacterium]|nr:CapA family protein [Clostridia bacterium]